MHTPPSTTSTLPPPLLAPLRDPLFDSLREQLQGCDTPPAVCTELLAAFASHHAARTPALPWWRRLNTPGWAMAGAGLSGFAALSLLLIVLQHPPVGGSAPVAATEPANDNAFIALTTLERIEQDPSPQMLATTVPRASLMALGVSVTPEDAGDMVMAEMLVGADGSPLALRLAAH